MSGEERSLPEGWATESLEMLCSDVTYGYTAKSNAVTGDARMLRITDIQENRVDWESVPFCDISKSDLDRYGLKKWDLVFARTGATVGKSFLIRDDVKSAVYASYLIRVRCLDEKISSYLSCFFNTPDYWSQITDLSAGIGQPNVNGSKLKELSIPLAPLAEQKVIADTLDGLLAQVDTLQARLDAIPAILKRFRQSVLSAAVTGKLTGSTISYVQLDDVLHVSSGKALSAKQMAPNGTIPVYGGNGISGYHDDANCFEETIVIGRVGYYCGCVHMTPLKSWITDNALVVEFDGSKVSKTFLFWALQTINLRANDASTAQPVISGAKIYSLDFPIPPLPEQHEIVQRVEELFAYADQIEKRVEEARSRAKHLTQSILAKAFRGELTAQWRAEHPELVSGENSAQALLERIRAARAQAPEKGKRGRKPVTESVTSNADMAEGAEPRKRGRPRKV